MKTSYKKSLILGASVLALGVLALPQNIQAHNVTAPPTCHTTNDSGGAAGTASNESLCLTARPADTNCPATVVSSSSSSGGGDSGGGGYGVDVDGDGIGDYGSQSEAVDATGSMGVSVDNCGDCGSSSSSSSSGGDSGSGGGSVLCGHFFSRGMMPFETYMGDIVYSQAHIKESTKRGYWFWAVPLTRHLNKHKGGLVENMFKPFVLGWAKEMAYRVGYSEKGSLIGLFMLKGVAPFATLLGQFVQEKDYRYLTSEQYIAHLMHTA